MVFIITRLLDDYNGIYNYGFWTIADEIKVLNFPHFFGKWHIYK